MAGPYQDADTITGKGGEGQGEDCNWESLGQRLPTTGSRTIFHLDSLWNFFFIRIYGFLNVYLFSKLFQEKFKAEKVPFGCGDSSCALSSLFLAGVVH